MDFAAFFTAGLAQSEALAATYDPALVLASYLIAALAGYAFLHLTTLIAGLQRSVARTVWMTASALTMGLGVWAMHFVGMLAYRLPVPVGFDPEVTALSLVPAVFGAAVALHVVARPTITLNRVLVGGLFMGAGIGLMHYTGMAAMRLDALVRYDPLLFATSIVVAVALACVALAVNFWSVARGNTAPSPARQVLGAGIMGLAVAGMHYTAMTSTLCFAQPDAARGVTSLDPNIFAAITTIVAVTVLAIAIAAVVFDRRLNAEIAQRKSAADSARRTDARLKDAIETMPDSLAVFDAAHGLVMWNSRFRADHFDGDLAPGTKFAHIMRRRIERLWPEETRDQHAVRVATYTDRARDTGAPLVFKAPDGRWSLIRARRTADGGFVRVETDITAVKQAEELAAVRQGQLQQAQKMEAVGQLTGGLAHDFNNLLGVIIGNLDLLQEKVAGREEENALVSAALDFALRGAELNRRLLAFSRRQSLQPERVDVNEVLTGMTALLSRAVGERVTIRLDQASQVWPVSVDLAQFESAIVNLIVNARDAMPEGGSVVVDTANKYIDTADGHPGFKLGAYVCVSVTDTGTGMTPEVQARVFEPFFTTKAVGAGSGLGLSMVFGFIKQSEGYVTIYSEPGRGTVVRLYLPRAAGAEAAQPRNVITDDDDAPGGTETVLMVEDNDGVAKIGAAQLEDLGYSVIQAKDPAEALALMGGDAKIDLLFTDVVMPGPLDGVALALKARELRPGLKVLLTSGFPGRANITPGQDAPLPAPLLVKPYRRKSLAQALRQALDHPVQDHVPGRSP